MTTRAERRRAERAAARAEARARTSNPDVVGANVGVPDIETEVSAGEVEAIARAVGLGPRTLGGCITEIGIGGPEGGEIVIRAEDPNTETP